MAGGQPPTAPYFALLRDFPCMFSMDLDLDSKHGYSPSLHISGAILGPTQSSCKFLVKCVLVEQATAPSIQLVTKIAHLRKPVCQILRVSLLTSEHLTTPFGFRFLRLTAVWTMTQVMS